MNKLIFATADYRMHQQSIVRGTRSNSQLILNMFIIRLFELESYQLINNLNRLETLHMVFI